jgi:DNA-directed RNA polymerase subunit M/transcription elongation factor TFIIS
MEEYYPSHSKRLHVFTRIFQLLKENVNDKEEVELEKMALNIERGIFNVAIETYYNGGVGTTWNNVFENIYMAKSVSIYINVKPDSYIKNTKLLSRLLNKEFDEFELCKMTPAQLFPERWDEMMLKYKNDDIDEMKKPVIEDGILQCGKCRSYKTEYTEKQTRSADEPTTKFCYCHNCGHRWRFC